MPKIRYLNIRFDKPIMPYEIPYFRAAVIEASGRQSDLFHNHLGDQKYIYRYPLIQYKVQNKKASIVCINDGTDDIHYLLHHREFHFNIHGRMEKFSIEDVHLRYYNIQTWNRSFTYNILNWLPLNQENYRKYQDLHSLGDRIELLENILRGHFHAMAGGIEWDIQSGPVPFEARIRNIRNERFLEHKGQHHLAFHLNVTTNVSLPDYISVGKGASSGFGIVKQLKIREGQVHKPTRRSYVKIEEE